MAAGASPERADGLLQQRQFAAGAPMGMPTSARPRTGGQRPKGPSEWYSEDYAAASQSLFPQGFRPPAADDANFKTYYDIMYGKGSYQKAYDTNLKKVAPKYRLASISAAQLDKDVVKMINQGYDIGRISQYLKSPQAAQQNSLQAYADIGGQKNILTKLTPDQAIFRATEIYDDYINGKTEVEQKLLTSAQKNRDYKYGLPDPRLRYGTTTNLSAGTVDILTNPTAAKAYASFQQREKDPAKLSQYKNFLVTEANKRQLTPWRDEAKRRDFLKGKKIK